MATVGFERPRDLAVKTIEERGIGVDAGFEERSVLSGKCKGVLLVVEIPKLESSGSRITHWIRHHEVLDLRPTDTFDSNRLAAACDKILGDDADQGVAIETVNDRSKRELDNNRQHISEMDGVCGRFKRQRP